jgi:uncharacterized metal-binding protein YceD (DUF177 family)
MSNLTPVPSQPEPLVSAIISLRDLSKAGGHSFDITPDDTVRAAIAQELGMLKLRKLRFQGELTAAGKSDWQLKAKFGATVEQACVITSETVVTRIDVPVARLYLSDFQTPNPSGEAEFDGQDEIEALEAQIDLGAVMLESLALNLPDYPRIEGAELRESQFSPPGIKPFEDTETKPFASLAALRDKLDN